jgi:hypothetical protein
MVLMVVGESSLPSALYICVVLLLLRGSEKSPVMAATSTGGDEHFAILFKKTKNIVKLSICVLRGSDSTSLPRPAAAGHSLLQANLMEIVRDASRPVVGALDGWVSSFWVCQLELGKCLLVVLRHVSVKAKTHLASFPPKILPLRSIFWFLRILGSPFSLFLPGHYYPNVTSILRNN